MPYQKIGLFAGALIVVVGVILGTAYYLNQAEPAIDENLTYILTPVADGSYSGEFPPLDREVQFSESYPEDARAAVRGHIDELVSQLSIHPEDGNSWMELALWYHTANDFDAARDVWEFVLKVSPTNVTALANLGRVYHYSDPDYEKAEEYFMRAIDANPGRVDGYLELFDLYRYSYKTNTTAAVDIMRTTMAQFPDDIGLQATLGAYYRNEGNMVAARREYEAALGRARAADDISLISILTAELATLP